MSTRSPTPLTSAHPGFWMRSLQFAGLHRILHRVAKQSAGIRAKDVNRLVLEHRDYWTDRGEPSKTTLYHCRATLLNLGALRRDGQCLTVATENPLITALLDTAPVELGAPLPQSASEAFSSLILVNPDCHGNFFRLFLPRITTAEQFRELAGSVVWHPLDRDGQQQYELRSESSGDRIQLSAPIQIQSILYGVRDWACKQLSLLDEFYETGRGTVLFPISHRTPEEASSALLAAVLAMAQDSEEWTTVSIRDLLRNLCERDGFTVETLFSAISSFVRNHPGKVSLIPTIPNFAAITATSRKRADFQLGSVYHDTRGRVISHFRFHNTIREQHGKTGRST